MELKVTQIGNSLAVILPKTVADNLKLEDGGSLWLSEAQSGYQISPVDPSISDQMDLAQNIMKKRRHVLRELAK